MAILTSSKSEAFSLLFSIYFATDIGVCIQPLSQERFLSFSPGFCNLKSNKIPDWVTQYELVLLLNDDIEKI